MSTTAYKKSLDVKNQTYVESSIELYNSEIGYIAYQSMNFASGGIKYKFSPIIIH